MESINKAKSKIAGILFVLISVYHLYSVFIIAKGIFPIDSINIHLTGILAAPVLLKVISSLFMFITGVFALRQKKLGKMLTIFYLIATFCTLMASVPAKQYVISAMVLGAHFLLASDDGIAFVKKTEASKVKAQKEKQTTIYDEQLKAGILTKEEYDQIMKNQQ